MSNPNSVKYILIGGYRSRGTDTGQKLATELTKDFAEPVKILIVLFARERDRWDESFAADQAFFENTLPHTKHEVQLAQIETFSEQVKWADVVYMKGGTSTPLMMDALTRDRAWTRHLAGKVVAGSSCGAYVICRYYNQLEPPLLGKGLGLIPYKTLSHWQSPDYGDNAYWKRAYSELDHYGDKLPIIKLAEGEFRVVQS